jgi:hypothetical protein
VVVWRGARCVRHLAISRESGSSADGTAAEVS